jgi:hypothetical protein
MSDYGSLWSKINRILELEIPKRETLITIIILTQKLLENGMNSITTDRRT